MWKHILLSTTIKQHTDLLQLLIGAVGFYHPSVSLSGIQAQKAQVSCRETCFPGTNFPLLLALGYVKDQQQNWLNCNLLLFLKINLPLKQKTNMLCQHFVFKKGSDIWHFYCILLHSIRFRSDYFSHIGCCCGPLPWPRAHEQEMITPLSKLQIDHACYALQIFFV